LERGPFRTRRKDFEHFGRTSLGGKKNGDWLVGEEGGILKKSRCEFLGTIYWKIEVERRSEKIVLSRRISSKYSTNVFQGGEEGGTQKVPHGRVFTILSGKKTSPFSLGEKKDSTVKSFQTRVHMI